MFQARRSCPGPAPVSEVFITGGTGYIGSRLIPATREGALRLGLVTIGQMVGALLSAVETPARGVRIVDVDGIRHPSATAAYR
jgi:nucleoside-diphosphate-sugar epimerase